MLEVNQLPAQPCSHKTWIDSTAEFKVPKALRVAEDISMNHEKLYSCQEFEEKQGELNIFKCQAVEKSAIISIVIPENF